MNYGKLTLINGGELIDLNRVYKITLKREKYCFFWAFYLIDAPREYVKSIEFITTTSAAEWLKDKLNEKRKNDGQQKKEIH